MLAKFFKTLGRWLIGHSPTPVRRNAPCPCGSGRKYKRCCLENDAATIREARDTAARSRTNYIGGRATVGNRALQNANQYRRPRTG
jgi:hypothetical protein